MFSACRPVSILPQRSVFLKVFFFSLLTVFQVSHWGMAVFSEWTLLNFWHPLLTDTSCSCLSAPLPLFSASLYSSVTLSPPLFQAPRLLIALVWLWRDALTNNTNWNEKGGRWRSFTLNLHIYCCSSFFPSSHLIHLLVFFSRLMMTSGQY